MRGFVFEENGGKSTDVSIQAAENNGGLVTGYDCVFC